MKIGKKMKPIALKGFEHYLVDEHGGVYSTRKGGARPILRDVPYRLTPQLDRDGYLYVRLSRSRHEGKKIGVHVLVALTFVGPRISKQFQVRHKDGNPAHNYFANLCWGTVADNALDKVRHGRSTFGERNTKAKLSVAKVRAIRERAESGIVKLRLAEAFGVSSATISKITLGQTWKNAK